MVLAHNIKHINSDLILSMITTSNSVVLTHGIG